MPARRPRRSRSASEWGLFYRLSWPLAAAFWIIVLLAALRTGARYLLGV